MERIQVERNFPSFATEGPATSVLRGISANRDCPKTNGVYCLQVRQRRFLQGELEQLTEPPDPEGSVNFFRNYVKLC